MYVTLKRESYFCFKICLHRSKLEVWFINFSLMRWKMPALANIIGVQLIGNRF